MKIDSIALTVPSSRTFTYTWLGKEETETMQLPPYAHVWRGTTITHTYWHVSRGSLARLHRAQVALAKWEA